MPAPTTITALGWDVIFEIEDTVNYITTREPGCAFGTVVLVGMNVLTVSVGEIVFGAKCELFQEGSYTYARTTQDDTRFKYTVPP